MPSPTLKTDTPIAGYTLRERIGAGGYGEVWKAEAPGGLGKAIKFIYGFYDEQRATCELRALNRVKEVRHPFLLSLERIEVVDGQLVIVTELADCSLRDRYQQCQTSGQLGIPRDELLGHLRDAADALDFMSAHHALQHLDVKPENLLVVGERVKVADFGLVRGVQDATVSLVGGLTPIYAAPEVFDGRPTFHSDQYSLAIVYQEMLTGMVPFPGKTPVQLAAQHLNSQPRLFSLSPEDQATIGRALSKNPDDRFGSCRAMIDSLLQGPEAASRCSPATSTGTLRRQETGTDTAPVATKSAPTSVSCPKVPEPPLARSQTHSTKTVILDELPDDSPEARGSSAWVEPREVDVRLNHESSEALPQELQFVPQAAIDLPPLDVTPDVPRIRPTLFLGIGGIGNLVLRRLRRQLTERFGDLAAVPALRMLLLETDNRSILDATESGVPTVMDSRDTVYMPLRRPQEYREHADRLLQWLSRRWLYNIPRSLKTEGLRPLGRLALIDHRDALRERLTKVLEELTDPQALAASARQCAMEPSDEGICVFVIASTSGGTGSGMVLDAAYTVRELLADLGIERHKIYGMLIHSAGRGREKRDLAVANTYACLTELRHYHRTRRYPAESVKGSALDRTSAVPFDDTYFLNLGEDIGQAELDHATDILAKYLYLDCATLAGSFFRIWRDSGSQAENPTEHTPRLRTFGLCQVGRPHDGLLSTMVASVCRTVVDRWCHATVPVGAETFPLDLDGLIRQVREIADAALVDLAPGWFTGSRGEGPDGVRGQHRWPDTLELLDAVLGSSWSWKQLCRSRCSPLQAAMILRLRSLAREQSEAAVRVILQAAQNGETRVRGSLDIAERIADQVRQLECEVGQWGQSLQSSLESAAQGIVGGTYSAGSKAKRWLHRAEPDKPEPDTDPQWPVYCQLRFDQLVLSGVATWLELLRSRVVAVADQLKDLLRKLGLLARGLEQTVACCEDPRGSTSRTPQADLEDTISKTLADRLPALIDEVDRQAWEHLVAEQGGLERILEDSSRLGKVLGERLRRSAGSEISQAVRQIDVLKLLLSQDAATEGDRPAVRFLLAEAAPRLLECGGARRLLVLCPEHSRRTASQDALARSLGAQASISFDADGDLVVCYEVEQIPLATVAASLIDQRAYCAQIASRLHTRRDVAWGR